MIIIIIVIIIIIITTTITTTTTTTMMMIIIIRMTMLTSFISRVRGFARQPCSMEETMKIFCIRKNIFFPIRKRIYCSCHETWMPCKSSIYKAQYRFTFIQVRLNITVRTKLVYA